MACLNSVSHAQTVVYDWSSSSKVPESYPKITRKQTVTFRITNVNDILFTYRLEVTQTPIPGNDFDNLAALFKLFNPGAKATANVSNCDGLTVEVKGAIQDAIKEISDDPKLPVQYAKAASHPSIPLRDSLAAWDSHAAAIKNARDGIDALVKQNCPLEQTLKEAIKQFLDLVADIERKVNSPHVFVDTHELSPGNDVSVVVVEMFGPQTISTKTFTFPGTDVLTLSAGALFSAIPDRTYEARKSPSSTLNILTVEGNSRSTPAIVGLMNYSLGALHLDGDTAGLALSAGPVIRLGAKSDASTFGFFAGVSGHLYHRFYITPGFHFGQFSDFPVGFSNGATVPANFGDLNPVKRWTTRFGLAITFKAKDFSGLGSSGTPSVKTEEGGGSTPKQPIPSGNSGANAGSSIRDANALFKSFLEPSTEKTSVEVSSQPVVFRVPERPATAASESSRFENSDRTAALESRLAPASGVTSARVRITSVTVIADSLGEHVILNSLGEVTDYSMYFNNGRFYVVIPHARLETPQQELRGGAFLNPIIERRADNLVFSFVLSPSMKAAALDRPNGLEIVFAPTSN
jgi:hypothetical protein